MMAKFGKFIDRATVVWFWCGLFTALATWMFEPITLWHFVLFIVIGPVALIIIAAMFIGLLF